MGQVLGVASTPKGRSAPARTQIGARRPRGAHHTRLRPRDQIVAPIAPESGPTKSGFWSGFWSGWVRLGAEKKRPEKGAAIWPKWVRISEIRAPIFLVFFSARKRTPARPKSRARARLEQRPGLRAAPLKHVRVSAQYRRPAPTWVRAGALSYLGWTQRPTRIGVQPVPFGLASPNHAKSRVTFAHRAHWGRCDIYPTPTGLGVYLHLFNQAVHRIH